MRFKILFSIALITASFAPAAYSQDRRALAKAQNVTGDRFTIAGRTARGANIFAVRQPSAAMLNAIDRGLADLFAVAKKNGYGQRLNYADYSIYIANADRTKNADGAYSPDFAVGAAQYAGSVYDQGGFIYAAGMVVSNEPCSFIIAEHARDFDRVANVVRYEGEHLVLYHNDRRRYNGTMDHSRGGGHPILQ